VLSTFAPTGLIYTNAMLAGSTETVVTNTSPGRPFIQFCFTPSGRMYYRFDGASTFTENNGAGAGVAINGGFLFTVGNRLFPDTTVRRVFVPLGSPARLAP
jgi:hypothetical protein